MRSDDNDNGDVDVSNGDVGVSNGDGDADVRGGRKKRRDREARSIPFLQ